MGRGICLNGEREIEQKLIFRDFFAGRVVMLADSMFGGYLECMTRILYTL